MGFAFLSGRGWEGCLWTENLLYLYSKTAQRLAPSSSPKMHIIPALSARFVGRIFGIATILLPHQT